MNLTPSRIKLRLKELNLSYSHFEDISGISASTLKRALSGDALRPATAAIMATALGTTVEWLSGTDEDENKPMPIINEPVIEPVQTSNAPESELEVSQPPLDVHFLISNMTTSYDKILTIKDEVIRQKNRWISILAVALGVMILALILLLGYDIIHPDFGWVQY